MLPYYPPFYPGYSEKQINVPSYKIILNKLYSTEQMVVVGAIDMPGCYQENTLLSNTRPYCLPSQDTGVTGGFSLVLRFSP
jgi:hypothetical protein